MHVTCDIGLAQFQLYTQQFFHKLVWLNQSAHVVGCTTLHCHLVGHNWEDKGLLPSQKERVALAYTLEESPYI
jgi:hypothetical protein